jgi:hypothetical protein
MTSGTTENLYGVWGSSPSDLFAVGEHGTILHYDGRGWSAMHSGTADYLLGVWGSGPGDVFAVGSFGTILHHRGGPHRVFLPLAMENYCSDFFDDFSNPASGWPVVDNDFVRARYLDGEYRVLSKRAGYIFFLRAPTCHRQHYVVQVDARWAGRPGASYGLIFGLTNGFDRFYLFDINTDVRAFRLLRADPSGFKVIVPISSSSAIRRGTASNHLKVTRNGDKITLEVNGTVLGTWSDGTITGLTRVGVTSGSYSNRPTSDARFDNFSATGIPGGAAAASGLRRATDGADGLPTPGVHHVAVPADLGWWSESDGADSQRR